MEKIKDYFGKLFGSEIKSYWAWVTGAIGVIIGSRIDIKVEPKKRKEVSEQPKKNLIDKLKEAIKEEPKK